MSKRFACLILPLAMTAAAAWAQDGFAPRGPLQVERCGLTGCERISGYLIPNVDRSESRFSPLAPPAASTATLRFQRDLGSTRVYLDSEPAFR